MRMRNSENNKSSQKQCLTLPKQKYSPGVITCASTVVQQYPNNNATVKSIVVAEEDHRIVLLFVFVNWHDRVMISSLCRGKASTSRKRRFEEQEDAVAAAAWRSFIILADSSPPKPSCIAPVIVSRETGSQSTESYIVSCM